MSHHRSQSDSFTPKSKNLATSKQVLLASNERAWLRRHGKTDRIDFDEKTRSTYRRYFSALDEDSSGTIGVDELLEPLIALGLAENREQVKALFDIVDTEQSEHIEFDEFLSILKCKDGYQPIAEFFRAMTNGNLIPDSNVLPFHLVVSAYRRKMLLASMKAGEGEQRVQGEKVMRALTKLKARQATEERKLRS